jgi:short-subunit dehydrogenase
VVTGASDGIGRAFADHLGDRGFSLVLVARRATVLEAVAQELARRHGARPITVAADLGTTAGRAALRAATADLDVGLLIAAAGFGTSGALVEASLADEEAMLAVNCGAVLAQIHDFGSRFAARGRGGLVLLSSIVAFQGVPRAAHYAATKAYVQTLAEGLARELQPRGVDVLACAPGPVRSGFAARARMELGATVAPETVAREAMATLGRRTTVHPRGLSKVLVGSLRTFATCRAGARHGAGHGRHDPPPAGGRLLSTCGARAPRLCMIRSALTSGCDGR